MTRLDSFKRLRFNGSGEVPCGRYDFYYEWLDGASGQLVRAWHLRDNKAETYTIKTVGWLKRYLGTIEGNGDGDNLCASVCQLLK